MGFSGVGTNTLSADVGDERGEESDLAVSWHFGYV